MLDSAQMIAKMKQIENAVPPQLEELVIFQKQEQLSNGSLMNHYQVPDGKRQPGYLWIQFEPQTKEVLAAEMNVNFNCLIGLNRSPIELRLLCNQVLKYLPGDMP